MKYLKALPYICIVVLFLMIGSMAMMNNRLSNAIYRMGSLNEITLEELDTEKIRHRTTLDVLEDQDFYSSVLEQQIADLKARPDRIKYVVRTETILEAGPTTTVKEIPETYTFRLKNGLAVAGIENKGAEYDLHTYDLKFKTQVAITGSKANVSVHANSSESPDTWVEVPVELSVTNTEKHTVLEPHIGIGIAAGYPWNVSGALWSTFVHLPKGVDFLGATVLVNNETIQGGLIPFAYNIGEPLPVFTNIWIAPAVTIDLKGQPGGALMLGGKL